MLRPYVRGYSVQRAHHAGQFVVDELHDLLAGAHRLDEQRADGPLAYPLDKAPRDFETHVRFEQVAADFAQGFGDVALRKDAAARETLQHGGELLGKGRKHKPCKVNGESLESKWGLSCNDGSSGDLTSPSPPGPASRGACLVAPRRRDP